MECVKFPFRIKNGRVETGDFVDEKVKRTLHYSINDVFFSPEVGAGLDSLVFSVGYSPLTEKVIKRNTIKALVGISEIDKANVVVNQSENGLDVNIFYMVKGENEMRKYNLNKAEEVNV